MNGRNAAAAYFNGIDAHTGRYLHAPLEPRVVSQQARGLKMDPGLKEELRQKHARRIHDHLGVAAGVNVNDLASAGWGVIFANDADPDVVSALSPLLERRKKQAGGLYREFVGDDGHRLDEQKNAFLARFGSGPGPVLPSKVPYYLLVVGSPERISFRFQYELDVAHAVGRVDFRSPAEYDQYARNIVHAESERTRASERTAAFVGVRNRDDPATQLSSDLLVSPLGEAITQARPQWHVQTLIGEDATKRNVKALLRGPDAPRLLFTASHGVGFDSADVLQESDQGALLCQDWPGPLRHEGSIPREFYLSQTDIADDDDLNLTNSITFHFACFSAGTPQYDSFPEPGTEREEIAPQPFVAPLAQRLLTHPNGPLAVVGHVDRALGFSFLWNDAVVHREAFRSALSVLMDGQPLGSAIEYFNQRHAEISSMLTAILEDLRYRKATPEEDLELADLWLATNDARNLGIIGDPAVRLE